jgi:hypothetical protein
MSEQNPIDEFASEVDTVRRNVASLQSNVRLASVLDELEDIDTRVNAMPQRVLALRNRNYAFEKGLESRISDVVLRWSGIRPSVQTRIDQECMRLNNAIRPIEAELSRLIPLSRNPAAGRSLLNQVNADVSNLQSKVNAAQNALKGMYDAFANEINEIHTHLEQVEWMCTQLDEACFQLIPTESCIMAVKAVWYRNDKEDKDDPKGVLYLTDQRLLFEQKEEVATKKVLFITTEKKKVQNLLFMAPVTEVAETNAIKKGLFKNEDHLELRFSGQAPFPFIGLHIFDQPCNTWQGLINQARSGDIQKTRAILVDEEAIEKVKAAPTKCPSCGATLDQPVLRGMDAVTCPYCGTVIRLP